MTIESRRDMIGLTRIGRVVGMALQTMGKQARPGITTAELDAIGGALLERHGARPVSLLTYGFPGVACISINDEAAHGIPGSRVIRKGDLVKIDMSAELGGYCADAAITVAIPPVTAQRKRLCACTRFALEAALDVAQVGRPLHVIGRVIEAVTQRCRFRVIADLPGHGIGKALHEEPTVPTFYLGQANTLLTEGLVITIEPHVAMGQGRIVAAADGWTLKTRDKSPVAHFEHTVVITRERPIVLTAVSA